MLRKEFAAGMESVSNNDWTLVAYVQQVALTLQELTSHEGIEY